ncbi:unnamed protein product [Lactuca virosa]|uniref:Disease resistance protein At4g27190-like leucine-rich repeats domain-containing protein n=1 Tax=Lactuca virosa TaxID=75947 RepID=A0AAU9NAE3_9ASTR|nr:unnamed protein product [Lactuca virosa]
MAEDMQHSFSTSPATSQPNIATAQNSTEIHNPIIEQTTPTPSSIPTPDPSTPTTPTTIPGDHQHTSFGQTSQVNFTPDTSSSPATTASSSPKVQKVTLELCTPSPAIPASSNITHPATESPESLNPTLKISILIETPKLGVFLFAVIVLLLHTLSILSSLPCIVFHAELRYLFTLSVAKVLSNLEHLQVFDCLVMKELIHTKDRGEETITFPKLKLLLLSGLPELLDLWDLCQNVNIIALPQLKELRISGIPNITSIYSKNKPATSCLLKEDVLVPKLEKLYIEHMGGLEEIWPCDFRTSEKVKLREIEVVECENLVNIFPCNPMPLLCELEGFKVKDSGSVESLFNIDLDCIGETGEGGNINSLRNIEVEKLRKLREVWRIKGGENNSCLPIRCFQVVESISIESCKRFRNFLSPLTTDFDLGALIYMKIDDSDGIRRKYGSVESSSGQENTLFPSCLTHSFHNLHNLKLERYLGVEGFLYAFPSPPLMSFSKAWIISIIGKWMLACLIPLNPTSASRDNVIHEMMSFSDESCLLACFRSA